MVRAAMRSLARCAALLLPLLVAEASFGADARYDIASGASGQVVEVGVGKSYVVDLPRDASEVLVADPKVANAVVRSSRKAYVIGVAIGETDVIFFDADGNQIRNLAVSVGRDLSPIRNNLRTSMPDATVNADAVGDLVMLTGSVRSAAEAKTATDIAANLVGSPDKVVNALAIEGRDQVLLKVTVAEVNRSAMKQLGVKWDVSKIGGTSIGFGSNPGYPITGASPGSVFNEVVGTSGIEQNVDGNGLGIFHQWSGGQVLANVEALERNSLLRTLAEPTLTAISGEKADFLAGGEFPVPVPTDNGIGIEYKKYGVSVTFTPVVLSGGRISLQVGTEVSEPNSEGVTILGTSVRGLNVRRASTSIELPSGGSLALAGLLQENTRQAFEGLPGILNVPVLGALFRSRDYTRGQTELVIIVTPYIAKPAGRDKLARPDDNLQTPTDMQAILLGRLNKIYSPAGIIKVGPGEYRGPIGHIVE